MAETLAEWTEADQARADLIADIACEIRENEDVVAMALDAYDARAAQPISTYARPSKPERVLLYWPARGWITGTYYEELEDRPLYTRARGYRGDGDKCIANEDPTHWMPLPKGPATEDAP